MHIRLSAPIILLAVSTLLICPSISSGMGDRPYADYSGHHAGKDAKTVGKTLTAEDDGREISVGIGEAFKVELDIQGGTGYDWYVDEPDVNHLQLIDTATVDVSPKGIVGGPVKGVWTFKAVAPGDTSLRMLYYRIWEGKDKAARSFSVKIHIAEETAE